MDATAALLKSSNMRSELLLFPPPEAGVGQCHLWRARKAIYGLAGGRAGFCRTLGDFLRRGDVCETQAGSTFAQTAADPCV